MGLLTNPETRSKMLDLLVRKGHFLSVLTYLGGLIWFIALMHPDYNGRVYFSENALLPGLVDSQYRGSYLTNTFNDYKDAFKGLKSENEVPTSWLKEELVKAGVEVYSQKYSFTYPMNLLNNRTIHAENVYAILRAPRSSSTESIILTAPLRPSGSGLTPTTGSVALMLSLAKEMRAHPYWAKDIIFVFPQHEFIGMQAWLDGYLAHKTTQHINADSLEARAGAIQAAINLEFGSLSFDSLEVLTEGINGILPNLDLVNLVHRLAKEHGITTKIHGQEDYLRYKDSTGLVMHNLKTAFLMMCHQATGMASGNHGLFLRYRIDAVTIKAASGGRHRLMTAGLLVEGVVRSLNNLLEKLHQSFFFYILPSTDRYISIGVYMPPFALMAASVLIQALALWGKFSHDVSHRDENLKKNKDNAFTADGKFNPEALSTVRLPDSVSVGIYHLLPVVIGSHLAGLMVDKSPEFFGQADLQQLPAVHAAILGALACIVSCMLLARSVMRREEFDELNWRLLKSICLIYYGLVLFSLALLNISLALIVALVTIPVYCLIRPLNSGILTILQALLMLLVSPLGVMVITSTAYNHLAGIQVLDKLVWSELLGSVENSLIYALIDNIVFKNYLVNVVSLVLYPIWLMLFSVIWMNV